MTGDPSDLTMLAYAVTAGIILLPLRWGALLGLLTAATVVAGTWAVDGAVDWSDTFVLLMMTAGMVTVTQLIRTVNQLRAAHDRIRALAVADERSRLARDLHDVLGHSLRPPVSRRRTAGCELRQPAGGATAVIWLSTQSQRSPRCTNTSVVHSSASNRLPS